MVSYQSAAYVTVKSYDKSYDKSHTHLLFITVCCVCKIKVLRTLINNGDFYAVLNNNDWCFAPVKLYWAGDNLGYAVLEVAAQLSTIHRNVPI